MTCIILTVIFLCLCKVFLEKRMLSRTTLQGGGSLKNEVLIRKEQSLFVMACGRCLGLHNMSNNVK